MGEATARESFYESTVCFDEDICGDDYFAKGAKAKQKFTSFASMRLNFNLSAAIRKKGYSVPTPIQRKVIPRIFMGNDVVAMARTGSGKTLAFVIPILQNIQKHEPKGIRALILSPTRELCQQTYKYLTKFSKGTDVRVGLIVGGDKLEFQFELLSAAPDILVASPGRLLHLLSETGLSLKMLEVLVFDEADRLLEMGFKTAIETIVSECNPERQTLLFSATLPSALIEFSRAGLKNPEVIRLDTERHLSHELLVEFFVLRSEEKPAALMILLKDIIGVDDQVLVFVATRHHAEYLYQMMQFFEMPVTVLYGRMDAAARKINYSKFVKKKSKILIVTDIAARGVDIPELDVVINYDFPDSTKLFIHRVGRTARAGKSGKAYSLLQSEELPYLLDLKNFLKTTDIPSVVCGYENMECGRFPQMYLEQQRGYLCEVNRNVDTLGRLYEVLQNSRKRYNTMRAMPSSWAIKNSKSMVSIDGEMKLKIHSMLMHLTSEHECRLGEFVRNQIKAFRPQNAIFEVEGIGNVLKKDKLAELMQKRVYHVRNIRERKMKRESLQRNGEDLIAGNASQGFFDSKKGVSAEMDGNRDCGNNESEDGGATKKSKLIIEDCSGIMGNDNEKKQKNAKADWRDEKYFLPISKMGEQSESNALGIRDFKSETLEEMEFHVMPDDGSKDIFRKRLLTKWVKGRKKFIKVEDTNEGRKKLKIKNESGKVVIVNDSNRNKIYEKWVKTTGKKIPSIGEDTNAFMPKYEFYRHKSKPKNSDENKQSAINAKSSQTHSKSKKSKKTVNKKKGVKRK